MIIIVIGEINDHNQNKQTKNNFFVWFDGWYNIAPVSNGGEKKKKQMK